MKKNKEFLVLVERVGSESERKGAYSKAVRRLIDKCAGVGFNEKGYSVHTGVYGRTGGKGLFASSSER